MTGILNKKIIFFLALVVIVYGGVTWVLASHYSAIFKPFNIFYSAPFWFGGASFVVIFFFYLAIKVMHSRPSGSLFFALGNEIRRFFVFRRFYHAAPVVLLVSIFVSLFTCFKNVIPEMAPFYLDPWLSEADKAVHLGIQPWEVLVPSLLGATGTVAMSVLYKIWFMLKYGFVFWQAFSLKQDGNRERFFIAMVLCWLVLGSLMATLMSSSGPCYFGFFYPEISNPYEPLMQYLYQVESTHFVPDIFAQEYLLDAYQGKGFVAFSGISAMPSMHVSMATLFLLTVWRLGKVWRWIFGLYLLGIQIGSVSLGWHYALDGYVAIVATVLLWWLAGKFVDWLQNGTSEVDGDGEYPSLSSLRITQ